MALTWSAADGRFRDERGQFVSERSVRAVVDQLADGASERMAQASTRLLAGELSLAEWQAEMMRSVKLSQVAAATIANGGQARMTFSEYGSTGRLIRDQYAYLREFAEQVADGRQPLSPSLTARARQYGQAARATFERTYNRGQQRRGYRFERNVLADAEHCRQCVSLTRQGWVPIGSLPPVGTRTCRQNDRCSISYRREPAEAVA